MHVSERGFTLIEVIVGMVVLAVAMLAVVNFVMPQSKQGIDPIWQMRALNLAQSLQNEIGAKQFDQMSDPLGGQNRCNEGQACTNSANLGPDSGETRSTFNDVDDYHGLSLSDAAIVSTLGLSPSANGVDLYSGYVANIQVYYDDNLDGVNDDDVDGNGTLDTGTYVGNQKLIIVSVRTPGNEAIELTRLKGNF